MSYGLGHSAPRRTKSKNIHTSATPHATSSLPPTSSWPADWPCGWLLAGFWLRTHAPRHAHDSHALPALAHRERWHHHAAPRGSSSLVRSLARRLLLVAPPWIDSLHPSRSSEFVGTPSQLSVVFRCFAVGWLAGWLAGQQAGRQKTSGLRSVVFSKGRTIYLCCHTPCIAMAPARPTSWRRGRRCRCSCRVQGSGRAGPPPE